MVRYAITGARPRHPVFVALFFGTIVFAFLWFLNAPFRRVYQATDDDVTALVDGSLLLPGAHWWNWFTQGHSHFFDSYPEWPWGLTPYARPAFQFLIYLAHFVLDRDWASYLAINYLGIAGIAAAACAIAGGALRLGGGPSVLAGLLVVASPPALEFSGWTVGFASETLASALVGGAFLAILARRDRLCLLLLLIALFTKETAVWAPFAAGLTILLRPGADASLRDRIPAAAATLLPLAAWLFVRIAFFEGIGGSYATVGYSPFSDFLRLVLWKLTHLHRLFVSQEVFVAEGQGARADRALMIGTYLLLALLFGLWLLSALRMASVSLGRAAREQRWPTLDAAALVSVWTAMALAFHFALALDSPRYASAAVMFGWPAVIGEVVRRRQIVLRAGLVACFVLVFARAAHLVYGANSPAEQPYRIRAFRSIGAMEQALRAVPMAIEQIYVLSASGLVPATPEYLRTFLGLKAEIIRVVDIHSYCTDKSEFETFGHQYVDGVVTITMVMPPDCASFYFDLAGPGGTTVVAGRLRRSDSISYELPEARLIDHKGPLKPALEPGSRMVVHIRPHGPARFLIEGGGPDSGIAWFDAP